MKRESIQAILVAAFVATAAFGAALLQDKGLHYKVLAGREELIKSMDELRLQLAPATEREIGALFSALSSEAANGITVDRRSLTLISGADDEPGNPRFEWQAKRDQIFRVVPQAVSGRNRTGLPSSEVSRVATYAILPTYPDGSSYGVVCVALGENVNPIQDQAIQRAWPKTAAKAAPNVFLWIDIVDKSAEDHEHVARGPSISHETTKHAFGGWSAWQDESPQVDKCKKMIFSCKKDRTFYVLQYRQKKNIFGNTKYQHRWQKRSCGC